MKLASTIRSWVQQRAIRVYFWLQKQVVRKAVRLSRISLFLLDAEIRLAQPSLLQLGESERTDQTVEYVGKVILGRPISAELEQFIQLDSQSAIELLDKSKVLREVKDAAQAHFLANSFLAAILKNDADRQLALSTAKTLGLAAAPYDSAKIASELRRLTSRLRGVRKQLAERSAIKFDVSIANITSLLGLVSIVFVASGFLYTRYFFSRFGVDVSLFFTLSDYLAASIEQIRYGAFAALFGLAWFAVGMRIGSMRSRLEIRANADANRLEGYFFTVFTVALIIRNSWDIYIDNPNFDSLRLTGLLCALSAAEYLSKWFFSARLQAIATMAGLFIFGTNVGISAYQRSEELLAGRYDSGAKVEVILKAKSQETTGQLMGANSAYVFLLAPNRRTVLVIPRDSVELIRVKNQ